MKNVGILTFHDGINYGGFLQTLALAKAIAQEGYMPSVINYRNPRHLLREYSCHFLNLRRNTVRTKVFNVRKMLRFNRSFRDLPLTERVWHRANLNLSWCNAVVLGSDEIWNYKSPYSGYDPVYFGLGLNASKIISYAASFGALDANTRLPNRMNAGLKRLHSISVRDTNSQHVVKNNIAIAPPVVLDPAFLYSFEENNDVPESGQYILVYSTSLPPDIVEATKRLARDTGRKLIAVGYRHSWCDQNVPSLTPFEWLNYIKRAEFIITTMFHGTIYSVLNRKRFILCLSQYRQNKFLPMLEILQLANRIPKSSGDLAVLFKQKIDYDTVFQMIDEHRQSSLSYLRNALGKDEGVVQ